MATAAFMLTCEAAVATANEADEITSCFDGLPAGPGDASGDAMTDYLVLAKAAGACHPVVQKNLKSCIEAADKRGDDPASYYDCVGLGANACIDSDWATSEFHKFACTDIEENFWVGVLEFGIEQVSPVLQSQNKPTADDLKTSFSAYRNEKCGLFREVSKSEPLFSYAACSTEATARMAIDIRILSRALRAR